jgi:hypothetical protein
MVRLSTLLPTLASVLVLWAAAVPVSHAGTRAETVEELFKLLRGKLTSVARQFERLPLSVVEPTIVELKTTAVATRDFSDILAWKFAETIERVGQHRPGTERESYDELCAWLLIADRRKPGRLLEESTRAVEKIRVKMPQQAGPPVRKPTAVRARSIAFTRRLESVPRGSVTEFMGLVTPTIRQGLASAGFGQLTFGIPALGGRLSRQKHVAPADLPVGVSGVASPSAADESEGIAAKIPSQWLHDVFRSIGSVSAGYLLAATALETAQRPTDAVEGVRSFAYQLIRTFENENDEGARNAMELLKEVEEQHLQPEILYAKARVALGKLPIDQAGQDAFLHFKLVAACFELEWPDKRVSIGTLNQAWKEIDDELDAEHRSASQGIGGEISLPAGRTELVDTSSDAAPPLDSPSAAGGISGRALVFVTLLIAIASLAAARRDVNRFRSSYPPRRRQRRGRSRVTRFSWKNRQNSLVSSAEGVGGLVPRSAASSAPRADRA